MDVELSGGETRLRPPPSPAPFIQLSLGAQLQKVAPAPTLLPMVGGRMSYATASSAPAPAQRRDKSPDLLCILGLDY